jgi:hypothetical protein
MALTLAKAISQCPKSMFGKRATPGKSDGRPPNYPAILAAVAKAMLTDAGVKYNEATIDAVAEVINPSTLQRQVAQHRETITGKIEDGVYLPVAAPKPKVKVAPRGVDPISGEKVRRPKVAAAKGKKAQAEAKAKATAKNRTANAPETPAKKARTVAAIKGPKEKREAAVKKVAKAAAKPASKPGKVPDNALAKARAALAAKKEAAKKEAAKAAPDADDDDDDVI